MPLNKSAGNMYPWVTHTWNPIRGRCPHECMYCYMRRTWPKQGFHFAEREMNTRLGEGKKIFIGSSFDVLANSILNWHAQWVLKVLLKIQEYPKNQYLFQTKNPKGFSRLYYILPTDAILGVTLESNRDYPSLSKAAPVAERVREMVGLRNFGFATMISIEPILDFDLHEFFQTISSIRPAFVSIGADSKNHHLPEPSTGKTKDFIEALQQITEIRIKDNLERIVGMDWILNKRRKA